MNKAVTKCPFCGGHTELGKPGKKQISTECDYCGNNIWSSNIWFDFTTEEMPAASIQIYYLKENNLITKVRHREMDFHSFGENTYNYK